MPDISMCQNETCPLKLKCYRYMAVPSDWQSYSTFEGGEDCESFIEIYPEDLTKMYNTKM